MTLGNSRVVVAGETPHAHEREGLDFVIDALPNADPFQVWAFVELADPSSGRLYEIDLLVLGHSCLYLVEMKSGPGRYEGDMMDWYRTAPESPTPRYMENPHRLTNHKAKVLRTRLMAHLKDQRSLPWIEPLVFLSAKNVETRFRHHGDMGVVTRQNFVRAVSFHDIPGVPNPRVRDRLNTVAARDIAQALHAIGIRGRKSRTFVGSYELGSLLLDGPGYQDRVAVHRDQKVITRRAHTWTVPKESSVERRQQLRRAADREAQLLWDVREHPHILRFVEYVSDAEIGPTVLFDSFDGMPLDAFLRSSASSTTPLSFFDRVDIVEQIARALHHCHKKGIVHGALSPDAVLVRRAENSRIETRLFNFQLGGGADVEGTMHWSALASEPWAIYQAPELRENPAQRSPASDLFSLGALATLILTGKAPGSSAVEIDQRLARDRDLDPRVVDDSLPAKIADLIAEATQLSPIQRLDDVEIWIESILAEVTRPTATATTTEALPEPDPLLAQPGDILGDDLIVALASEKRAILGQGATARVLAVERVSDARHCALKISLAPEHDERLRQEGAVIAGLRHARIVQMLGEYRFGGRPALLLSLAGTETLHRHLQREGTVSLERAARYGDDLLSAVEYLEEQDILHRDIKPANLGVGVVGKKADHLTLFDFSLATTPKTDLQVGTAIYRDPYLRLRGQWDFAAERWSAAVTLHEMLTGIRPGFQRTGEAAVETTSALDVDARIVVAVERFDPGVRDRLAAFFERAFARDLEQRFASTDEMRRAWISAFEAARAGARAPSTTTTTLTGTTKKKPLTALQAMQEVPPLPGAPTADAAGDDEGASHAGGRDEPVDTVDVDDAALPGIGEETPIEALPLSLRAKNALDRAGFMQARDLLHLADNRLSAIRGVGRTVATEILSFRDRWRQVHTATVVEATPFFPNYRGEDHSLSSSTLPAKTVIVLEDAGLLSLSAVAQAPAAQVRALAKRKGIDVAQLRTVLDRENAGANERARPTTLEGWVEALLPKKKKALTHIRELYGLQGPFAGQLSVTVKALSTTLGITTAAIYLALGKLRDDLQKHAALPELRRLVRDIVEQAGGTATLDQVARALLVQLPHDRGTDLGLIVAQAAALARLVADFEKDDEDGLRTLRVQEQGLWLCLSDGHARGTKALGEAADALAARPSVPGPGEVARALQDAASASPLSTLSTERQADIAAAASRGAARSARLEIYPQQMEPSRSLALSAAQLKSGLTPAEIGRRVLVRYPAAAPLPPRPDLDALLKPHGLVFDDVAQVYLRPGEAEHTVMATRVSSTVRPGPLLPAQVRALEQDDVAARQFDEQVRNAIERRAFKVIAVRADRAVAAALRLGERLGVEPTALDTLLVHKIRARMAAVKREDIVHAADREGRAGPAWNNLLALVKAAATDVGTALTPRTTPLLLVQPGLLARYRLEGLLQTIVSASTSSSATAPTFLLVPAHDGSGVPLINGELAIPGITPGQVLWVPLSWLKAPSSSSGTPPPDPTSTPPPASPSASSPAAASSTASRGRGRRTAT